MYAIYIDSTDISGAEKRALKLFYELNIRGIECKLIISKTLFNLFSVGEYRRYLSDTDCIVIEAGFLDKLASFKISDSRFYYLRRYTGFNHILAKIYHFQLKKVIKNIDIDILHSFLGLKVAFDVKKYTNFGKVIIEITSPDLVKKLSSYRLNTLEKIDYFNAVSDSTYINAVDFIPRDKISQAPIAFFDPEYTISEDKLWNNKENIIIFAHRLIPRKNGWLFAKVIKQFLKHHSSWKIKIFGRGSQAVAINNLLTKEILLGQVITGYRKKILPELERSKIFVSLIEPDNYPSQSVLEAMYAGNALLLSDCGFTRERFFADNGMLCELTLEDVLLKLTKLVSSETDLELFGKNSRILLNNKYDKQIYIDYISEMYKSISRSG
jgi:glycosyltransferase involved in cell wall biosynthesis